MSIASKRIRPWHFGQLGEAELWSYLPKDSEYYAALDLAAARVPSLRPMLGLGANFLDDQAKGKCDFPIVERVDGLAIVGNHLHLSAAAARIDGSLREWVECMAKREELELETLSRHLLVGSAKMRTATAINKSPAFHTYQAKEKPTFQPGIGRAPILSADLVFKATGRL